ncbi:hypothetical protein HEP_00314200 [Hepatocystis sp. ex Piliocolobus tephrosceles]|nr:hypothetical protein HEP_00314200 [Hepatocystis sp. ex Piliocolobus tephrosceles]
METLNTITKCNSKKGRFIVFEGLDSYKIAEGNGLLLHSFKLSDFNFRVNINNRFFYNMMHKYIQSTILLVSLCYPLKIEQNNDNVFNNICDKSEEANF